MYNIIYLYIYVLVLVINPYLYIAIRIQVKLLHQYTGKNRQVKNFNLQVLE